MLDFLNSIINYFHQYTLADTANVFAIVEGLATVVAAAGAIFAVVETKKIAKKQISIANKQNDISKIQASIAEQQNSIALLNQRMETLRDLENFFREWELIDFAFQSSQTKVHSMFCRATLLIRTCVRSKKLAKEMSLMDYMDLQCDQITYDTKMLDGIPYLFELDEESERFIDSLKAHYINLTYLINDRMQSDESEDPFSIIISRFTEFFKKNKNELIESLKVQTKLKLNKREE